MQAIIAAADQPPFFVIVLFELCVIGTGAAGIAGFVAIILRMMGYGDPPERPDKGEGGGVDDPAKPGPTGGDHIDWDKFHRDLNQYGKEIETREAVGAGIR